MSARPVRIGAVALVAGLLAPGAHGGAAAAEPPRAHVETSFSFAVRAPMARVAPLFGAEGERAWAGEHWNPTFLHPVPARDVAGEVFQVQHGAVTVTWVNTAFDLPRGHVQYAYVVPDAEAVLIDIRLAPAPGPRTIVKVVYQRTSLDPDHDEHVRAQAKHDAEAGTEWAAAIAAYLERPAPH